MRASRVPTIATACLLTVSLWAAAGPAEGGPLGGPGSDDVVERLYDGQGRLVWERGLSADDRIGFERFYRQPAKPESPGNGNGGGKGGGGGGDGGGDGPGTDCPADQYRTAGWAWSVPFTAEASSHAPWFDAAGHAWDDATGASLFGGVTAGSGATAGIRDGMNRFDFVDLGAGGTIAVTTTWYNRFTGEAVESDAQYNTYYAWATDGSAGAMDVLNIAVHEMGHTFGLDHPNGPAHKIGCLSMYAYGDLGETQKRTLGDGDVLGIRAVYGA